MLVAAFSNNQKVEAARTSSSWRVEKQNVRHPSRDSAQGLRYWFMLWSGQTQKSLGALAGGQVRWLVWYANLKPDGKVPRRTIPMFEMPRTGKPRGWAAQCPPGERGRGWAVMRRFWNWNVVVGMWLNTVTSLRCTLRGKHTLLKLSFQKPVGTRVSPD